ncbi:MAG: class I SAM-dependent methyltransferase [Bdellovibrionota bacterium]
MTKTTLKNVAAFSEHPWPEHLLAQFTKFQIPVNLPNAKWDFLIGYHPEEGVSLTDREKRVLKINFDTDPAYHRQKVFKKDPLIKALGVSQGRHRVWDLTAGLGRDALMMAHYGLQVTSFERNPALFLLLQEAARSSEECKSLKLRFDFQDAETVLTQLPQPFPENGVIYFDPMFPTKKKSALPPQEMVILRELTGADEDAEEIIEKIHHIPGARAVIKRPDSAPQLKGVSHSIMAKLVRFDVIIVPPVTALR